MTAFDLSVPERTAPVFAALGDPCRSAIVAQLCAHGPLPTRALRHVASGISRQGIAKHLSVLEAAGLLQSRRVGRDREWRLSVQQIAELRQYLRLVSVHWDVRLERLKALVEGGSGSPKA